MMTQDGKVWPPNVLNRVDTIRQVAERILSTLAGGVTRENWDEVLKDAEFLAKGGPEVLDGLRGLRDAYEDARRLDAWVMEQKALKRKV